MKDRIKRKQFYLFWDKGKNNRADYFTKNFPPKHHNEIRYTYLHPPQANIICAVKILVQGCVNTMIYMYYNPKI